MGTEKTNTDAVREALKHCMCDCRIDELGTESQCASCDGVDAALAALAALDALEKERDEGGESQDARRDSLAQEIRETLQVRGLWAPKNASDLITAVGKALDEARAEVERLKRGMNADLPAVLARADKADRDRDLWYRRYMTARAEVERYKALRSACVGPCREMDAADWDEYFGGIQVALEAIDALERGDETKGEKVERMEKALRDAGSHHIEGAAARQYIEDASEEYKLGLRDGAATERERCVGIIEEWRLSYNPDDTHGEFARAVMSGLLVDITDAPSSDPRSDQASPEPQYPTGSRGSTPAEPGSQEVPDEASGIREGGGDAV